MAGSWHRYTIRLVDLGMFDIDYFTFIFNNTAFYKIFEPLLNFCWHFINKIWQFFAKLHKRADEVDQS